MLHDLSEEVRQCYENAEQCAGRARATQDEELRADYLRLARGWLKLAQSYGLRQLLTLFINEAAGRKNDLNQNIRLLASENKKMVWQPLSIAPFDRDLELAVRDGGDVHQRSGWSGWRKIVLHSDPEREPNRAKLAWESYLGTVQ